MKHRNFFILFTTIVALFSIGCQNDVNSQTIEASDTSLTASHKLKDTISIVAVGDMMLGSAFPSKANLPKDDAKNSFANVIHLFKGDIVFGNLEGCFLDSGKSQKCNGINPNACYAFRMPTRYAHIYKEAGFNLLSIANNHLGDFENVGRKRTAKMLDSVGIYYAGQKNKPYEIFEKDSVKYGFIAFAPNENTVQLNDYVEAKRLIAEVRPQVNILIISFHGGGEGSKFEHITKQKEIFYKENRGNVNEFAHMVIDAGADLVLGHGPHVTRAVEVYKKKFIAYSLGNFCTYGMFNLSGSNGIAPLLDIKLNSTGEFLYADVTSVQQDKVNRLTIDPKYRAFEKIKSLTDTDFPNHGLYFSNQRIELKP